MQKAIGAIAVLLAMTIVAPFFHQDSPVYGRSQIDVLLESATPDYVVSHASPDLKLLWVFGGGAAVGIGLWWARFPKEHERQNRLARFLGVVLYFFGSCLSGYWLPFSIIHEVELGRHSNYQPQYAPVLFLLAFGSALLLGSYFLCFRTRDAHCSE